MAIPEYTSGNALLCNLINRHAEVNFPCNALANVSADSLTLGRPSIYFLCPPRYLLISYRSLGWILFVQKGDVGQQQQGY